MRNLTHIQAIIFRRINNTIEFLILKRAPEKGGFWQPVTGGKKDEEKVNEAVLREVMEETGINEKNILNIINTNYKFNWKKKDKDDLEEYISFTEWLFGIEVDSSSKISLSKEHEEYKWCKFQEALNLIHHDTNKECLKKLKTFLK